LGQLDREPELTPELQTERGENAVAAPQPVERATPLKIDIALLDRNPYQPRQEFDEAELEQLAADMQKHGLLHPIVVRQVGERYQIIVGERRFRAAKQAGWDEIPAHCIAVEEREMVELALTENLQRKDLNAIEKAFSFANYLQTYGGTHEELAKRLEVERCTVSNLMRLLDLPEALQKAVRKGTLSAGHARALLPLEEHVKMDVADKVIAEGWSVRATEEYVRELQEAGKPQADWNVVGQDGQSRPAKSKLASEQVQRLEQSFRDYLGGMKVKLVQANEKGKGKLTISFANHEEFERLSALFNQNENRKAA
jgi:ParB family chromosome partitioning protein